MKNKIIFILIVILLTGCSLTEEIKIDDKSKVYEKTRIYTEISNISLPDNNYEELLNNYIDQYGYIVSGNKYTYKKDINNETVGVESINEYQDICTFFTKSLYSKKIFKNIDCNEESHKYIINAYMSLFDCDDDCNEGVPLDNAKLVINSDIDILNSNANEIEGNIHTWKFSHSSKKNVYLEIKKSKKIKNNNKTSSNKSSNTKVVLIGIVTIIIIVIITFILRMKYKNNKTNY